MEKEILGFNYETNGDGELNIKINPVIKKKEPQYLFKYLPLNEYTICCIEKSYFYLSSPNNFNDPFDCYREILGDKFIKEDDYYHFLFQKIGIVSMTNNGRHVLMWAHYCNNEGITLKFKTEYLKSLMTGVFYMNYQRRIPDLSKYDMDIRFIAALNIKSLKWRYESEWRLIKEKNGLMKSDIPVYDNMASSSGINLLDRRQDFDLKQLLEVTLGFKFITKEIFTKKENKIQLKIENKLKIKLLDYLIQKDIYTQIIDFGNITEFKLRKVRCKIEKIDDGEYLILLI